MMKKFLVGLIVLSILMEGTVTSLPLVLMSLILLTVFTKSQDVFLIAFLSGVILDILLVRSVGESSVFFLVMLFIVFLYDRKFEIQSLFFVEIITLVGASLYLIIFPSPQIVYQVAAILMLSLCLFLLNKKVLSRAKIKEVL